MQNNHQVNFTHLKFRDQIGKGGFGIVTLGTYLESDVAIKTFPEDLSNETRSEFLKEAIMMIELRSPRIVRCYGYCISPKTAIIMEYMPKGSLWDIHRSKNQLEWKQRIQIAIDMTLGLSYLHSREILHRDLKSSNVLLDNSYRAKLCDFGLALVKTASQRTMHKEGTPQWMAPELFKRKPDYTTKSDIYALGMTFWELASGKIPFADARIESIPLFVRDGKREDIPPACPLSFAKIIQQCWDVNPEKRPEIDSLLNELQDCLESLNTSPNPLPIIPNDETYFTTKTSLPSSTSSRMSTIMTFNKTLTARLEGGFQIPPQKIMTNDGRRKINDNDQFPASVHGLVKIDLGDGKNEQWGTGILIGPNMVLTAAHNIYYGSELPKKRFPNFTFIPGFYDGNCPFGEIEVEQVFVPDAYITKKSHRDDKLHQEDYGVLKLKVPIGDLAGYFGLTVLPKKFLRTKELNICGYPADKCDPGEKKFGLWGAKGSLTAVDSDGNLVWYPITTYPGQSGSGIFYEEGGKFFVIGVHIASAINYDRNIGIWITEERLYQIEEWRKRCQEEHKDSNEKFLPIPTNEDEEINGEDFELPDLEEGDYTRFATVNSSYNVSEPVQKLIAYIADGLGPNPNDEKRDIRPIIKKLNLPIDDRITKKIIFLLEITHMFIQKLEEGKNGKEKIMINKRIHMIFWKIETMVHTNLILKDFILNTLSNRIKTTDFQKPRNSRNEPIFQKFREKLTRCGLCKSQGTFIHTYQVYSNNQFNCDICKKDNQNAAIDGVLHCSRCNNYDVCVLCADEKPTTSIMKYQGEWVSEDDLIHKHGFQKQSNSYYGETILTDPKSRVEIHLSRKTSSSQMEVTALKSGKWNIYNPDQSTLDEFLDNPKLAAEKRWRLLEQI